VVSAFVSILASPLPLAMLRLTCLLAVLFLSSACQSAYFATMEKFGVHKREILVDRVEDGRTAQAEAKEEIVDALEAFKAATGFQGGELEEVYSRLNSEYEASAEAVEEVRERIVKIEDVAEALFEEWSAEIDGMQNKELSAESRSMLTETKQRYGTLIAAMRSAESKMGPVLTALKDNVTFLKHNLNARAIQSLGKSLATIQTDVDALVVDMERSIAEADAFIASMKA